MSVVTDTTDHEKGLTQKKGNHKGCPYGRLDGGPWGTASTCA